MEKVKPEIIVINDDSDDDEPDCKPTHTKKKLLKKRKKKRKVEKTLNTSSNTETLVITQKVMKQKLKCIINVTNVCEHREKKNRKVKPKTTKINLKECAKVHKIVPNCLRKKCKIDVKRKYDNNFSRLYKKEHDRKHIDKSYKRVKIQSIERKKLKCSSKKSEDKNNISSKHKRRRVVTSRRSQSHTRYLSSISSDSLSDILSECEEDMSYEDISSDSTTEIDTLIKRTKDRERNSSLNKSFEYKHLSNTSSTRHHYTPRAKVTEKHDKIKDSNILKRKRTSSLNRSYESNHLSNTSSTRTNYTSRAKVTEKHDKIKDSNFFKRKRTSSLNRSYESNHLSNTSSTRTNYTSRAKVTEKHDKIKDSNFLKRKRTSSLNRSYESNHLSNTSSTRTNYTSRAKVTEKHDKIKDSKKCNNAQLEMYKCRNKICAVQPGLHSLRYDCIKDIASIPLPDTDKPNHVSEYIIDIDGPNFMSTPKHEDNYIETHDASASDGGTVLTGEMDIVSFHSQGTLVLDTFCSPSHPTDSPSLIYDAYSPTMSPTFVDHENVMGNTPTYCNQSHLMPPDLKHLITNSAADAALQVHKPYSPSDSSIITIQNTYDIKNFTDIITLEANVKQEPSLKPKDVKVEHTSPKTDVGGATNVAHTFDIRSVKIEGAQVSEKRTIETIFDSPNINVNIKEEINDDSINNNMPLKPYHMMNLSMKIYNNNFEDDNLGIKKEE